METGVKICFFFLLFFSFLTAQLQCQICSSSYGACCISHYQAVCTLSTGPTFILSNSADTNLLGATYNGSSYFDSIVLPNQNPIGDGFQDSIYFSSSTQDTYWDDTITVNLVNNTPTSFVDSVWGSCNLTQFNSSCSMNSSGSHQAYVGINPTICPTNGYYIIFSNNLNGRFTQICVYATSTSLSQQWQNLDFTPQFSDTISIYCNTQITTQQQQTTQQQTTQQQTTQQTTQQQTTQQQTTEQQQTTQQQQIPEQTTQQIPTTEVATQQTIASQSNNLIAIIAGSVGGFFGIVCLIGMIVIICLLLRRKQDRQANDVPMNEVVVLEKKNFGDELVIEERIGSGNFGEVYKGKLGLLTVACKQIKREKSADLEREISILSSLKHPNIVQFLGIKVCQGNEYMVMEFMNGGNLLDYIRKHERSLEERDLLNMAYQIASGMEYLEEKKIIHKDLALRNILCIIEIDKVICKVSDFGLSTIIPQNFNYYKLNEEKRDSTVPVKWSAPEVLFKDKISSKSDVFSYGVVLFEIFSRGDNPWGGFSNPEVIEELKKGKRMTLPESFAPQSIVELIGKCWKDDPNDRPTFKAIVSQTNWTSKDKQPTVVYVDPQVNYNTQ